MTITRRAIFCAALAILGSQVATAGFVGDEVLVEAYNASGTLLGATSVEINDTGTPEVVYYDSSFQLNDTLIEIDFTDDSIIFESTNLLNDPPLAYPIFAIPPRWVFQGLDWVGSPTEFITDVEIVYSDIPASSFGVTFGPTEIVLEYYGGDTLAINETYRTELAIVTSPTVVPGPAAAPLALLGLGFLAVMRRKLHQR